MRFLHISDLHLGKTVHGVSLLENGDQPYWVDRFLALAAELRPEAVAVAGDVYDRGSPSAGAVALLSRLVEGLAELDISVLLVAGNHDSGPRLAFARDILARQKVHIAGTVDRVMTRVRLEDDSGPVVFHLMPYVFPAAVCQALGEDTVRDYDSAVRRLLAEQPIDTEVRNVIVAHQNVTAFGAESPRGGSESMVGGVGQVDYTAFDAFDYAALGHIHAAYPVGRDAVRYAGSPMCYHFNELRQPVKGPVLVELGPKGAPPRIETLQIPPLHPMRELRGPFEELREKELAQQDRGEYLRLVITDRPLTPEIIGFFQELAAGRDSILMEQVSEYRRGGDALGVPDAEALREKSLEELFTDFCVDRWGDREPEDADLALIRRAGELLRNSHPDPKQRTAVGPELTQALVDYLIRQEAKEE